MGYAVPEKQWFMQAAAALPWYRILRSELATQWRQRLLLWKFPFENVAATLGQPCPLRTRLAIWRIPNHPNTFLPLHRVAGNVHSQGSKSFPR